MRRYRVLLMWLIIFASPGALVHGKTMPIEFDAARNRLIADILGHQLPTQHFEHKAMDDELSRAAFTLFLQQLDPRKRFLLHDDITRLEVFSTQIDDELLQGKIALPDIGAILLNERIMDIKLLVDQLIVAGFDPNREEYLEMDPKKIDFAKNQAELRDRWRRILKMQAVTEYLELQNKAHEQDEAPATSTVPKKKNPAPVSDTVEPLLWGRALDKVHKDTTNYLARLLKETKQDYYDRYFNAVSRAYDPHTDYMAPSSKEDFDIHMRGSLEGIGALLREDDGNIKVVRIMPGSAAQRQGELQEEDIILSVGEKDGEPVDVTDMRIREAVSYIRGPKGSEVRLHVQKPDGSKKMIAIIRDVVQIEEAYIKSEILGNSPATAVGYIRVPSFYRDFDETRSGGNGRNVTDDMIAELAKLKEARINGLILDLRNNGGGSLADAVEITGLFLPGGPVVQVKSSEGLIRVLADEDNKVLYDGPLIVLVNKFSASASEILAAALQDYGRALILGGEHTHGKGTVQALFDMNRLLPFLQFSSAEDLGTLKITIQKFYRINGESTQYRGVHPDIVVPSILEYLKTGEQYQDYSLPWDQVDAVQYQKWQTPPYNSLAAKKRGEKWLAANEKFQKIVTETAAATKRSEQTLVPIFLHGMIREREALSSNNEEMALEASDLLSSEPNEKKGDKSLKDQLAEDPFIEVTLFLMNDLVASFKKFQAAR